MSSPDPLSSIERAFVAEEMAALVRHDLRNRFATIRNATFYLKRRVSKTELYAEDPRVGHFFKLVEDQIAEATGILDERMSARHLFAQEVRLVDVGESAALAVAHARIDDTRRAAIAIVHEGDGAPIAADRDELALAIRCLVENAAEASSEGTIRITCRATIGEACVEVADEGPGIAEEARDIAMKALETTKVGHAGLGLNIAQRIARRFGGTLSIGTRALASGASGASVTIAIPRERREP